MNLQTYEAKIEPVNVEPSFMGGANVGQVIDPTHSFPNRDREGVAKFIYSRAIKFAFATHSYSPLLVFDLDSHPY